MRGFKRIPLENPKAFLLYGISEIFFVLIGILLALQINNWNTERQQDETLKLQLIQLQADLKEDQNNLAHLKMIHEFKFNAFQYLLTQAGAPLYDPNFDGMVTPTLEKNQIWDKPIPNNFNKEFIEKTFLWSHRIDFFASNQNTFNEMKNMGMYSRISNPELKLAISGYYESWEGRFRILMRELVEDWQKSLEKDGVITSNAANLEDPITLIANNPERIAKVTRLARECAWWTGSTIVVSNRANELIHLLQMEINEL